MRRGEARKAARHEDNLKREAEEGKIAEKTLGPREYLEQRTF